MSAAEDMTRALLGMAERGRRPRCGDGEVSHCWTSDDDGARALAATWCAGCPLIELCWSVAVEVNACFGVYGGRDCADDDVRKQLRRQRRVRRQAMVQ